MLAMFHLPQPDGTVVATCGNYPGWTCVSKSIGESKIDAPASLLEHIETTTTFSHYVVPLKQPGAVV